MYWKIRYTYPDAIRANKDNTFDRVGKEIFRHPKGYFVTLEFQDNTGRFRESFAPHILMPV